VAEALPRPLAADDPVLVDGLTASEVEWLETAARHGAGNTLVAGADARLNALAVKLRRALRKAAGSADGAPRKLWEITVDEWSTYIVAADTRPEAERVAVREHRAVGRGEPFSGRLTVEDITPVAPTVVHGWSR
jgi:hypothetical protein